MNLLNSRRRPPRHPAVIDTLGPATASHFVRKAPQRTGSRRRVPRFRRKSLAVVATLLLAGLTLTIWATRPPHSTPTTSGAVTTAHPPTSNATPHTDECRADPGDQNSGEAAIRAFEYAYYVGRSGEQARKLATPTSSVQPAEALQKVIDEIPPGTTYCLHITPIGADVYMTVLVENRPGQPPQQWTQTVTTKQLDGRWYVDVFK